MSFAALPVVDVDYHMTRHGRIRLHRDNARKLIGCAVGAPVVVRDYESGSCLGVIASRDGTAVRVFVDFDTWEPEVRFYDVALGPGTFLMTDRDVEYSA